MANTEKLIAMGMVGGIALVPVVWPGDLPGPFDDVVLMVLFAIGAITLIEAGDGYVEVAGAELHI